MNEVAEFGVKVEGRVSQLLKNCDSTRQALRAKEFRAEIVSARSSEMVPWIQDLTQSMRVQSG